ncbi:MAG: hypothetical protein IPL06_16255 [Betaproteobacteria bacterium]|nr:hypothetical protein [Betaproteobacteria bacterium]
MNELADDTGRADDRARTQGVEILAAARARCIDGGLEPSALGNLFMQEALLAWMVDGMTEHDIHVRIRELVRKDLRAWFYNARLATGQCDCVREVHFDGMEELKGLFSGTAEAGESRQSSC